MTKTIFDGIIDGTQKSWKVWENDKYMAFLTPYPNTPGLTVVIPKKNVGDYVFGLNNDEYTDLLEATKTVANILERAFDTPRVAMVFEGTGVAHVHAKLYPLHGELAGETNVWSKDTEFVEKYRGWMTTLEGPRMGDEDLTKIQQKIIEASK